MTKSDDILPLRDSAEEVFDRKNKLLTALFEYSVKLSYIPFSENFYIVAAKELKLIFGAFGVVITTFSAESAELIVQYSTFSEILQQKAGKLIGQRLEGLRFKLNDKALALMKKERAQNVSSLYQVTFGGMSLALSKIVEKTFGLGWFSGITLQDQNTLIGTAVIIGLKKTSPPVLEELKGFSGVTAVALSRWLNEQKVLSTEMKFKLMAENMKDVLWQSDLSSKIIYISPSVLQILGYKPEDIINRYFTDIVTPESFSAISGVLKQRLKTARKNLPIASITYEIEFIHRNGTKFWAEVLSNPTHDHLGNITGFHGVARDISERKAAEIKIRQQYEKLEQINAEKDKFFSILAHDLKGALHGFLGYSQFMADRIRNLRLDKLEEYAGTIRSIALNLNELLENLLEWSLIQRNRITYYPEIQHLGLLVENSIRTFELQAKNKEIEIHSDIPPDLTVFVDNKMITSIIRNLISNSLKFSHRKGKVEIFTGENDDHFVEVMIRDYGIGIEDDILSKLFRIDSIVSDSGTEGESSSGLGLILCAEYVAKLGGKVWIESEVNKGTCVHFTIPLRSIL